MGSITPRQLKDMYWKEEMSTYDIAERCGVTPSAVQKKMKRMGIPRRSRLEAIRLGLERGKGGKQRLNKAEERRRMRLYQEGKNDGEIAEEVGVSRTPIAEWCKRRGLPPNEPTGLDSDKEERRMKLYRQGRSDREIADGEEVRRNAIAQWRYRRRLKSNKKRRWTKGEVEFLTENYCRMKGKEIAKELGRSLGTVW